MFWIIWFRIVWTQTSISDESLSKMLPVFLRYFLFLAAHFTITLTVQYLGICWCLPHKNWFRICAFFFFSVCSLYSFQQGVRTLFFSPLKIWGNASPQTWDDNTSDYLSSPKFTEFSLGMTKHFPIIKKHLGLFVLWEICGCMCVCVNDFSLICLFVQTGQYIIISWCKPFLLGQNGFYFSLLSLLKNIILTVHNIFLKINRYLFITGVNLVHYCLKVKANKLCVRAQDWVFLSAKFVINHCNLDVYIA